MIRIHRAWKLPLELVASQKIGIKQANFWCMGWRSFNWATLARAVEATLKDNLAEYMTLVVLFSNPLNMSFCHLLACLVSENFALQWSFVSLYTGILYFPPLCGFFQLLVFSNLVMMYPFIISSCLSYFRFVELQDQWLQFSKILGENGCIELRQLPTLFGL